MVERCVRDAEAVGSSPVTSTNKNPLRRALRGVTDFYFVVDGYLLANKRQICLLFGKSPRLIKIRIICYPSQLQPRRDALFFFALPRRLSVPCTVRFFVLYRKISQTIIKTNKRQIFALYIIYLKGVNVNRKRFPAQKLHVLHNFRKNKAGF